MKLDQRWEFMGVTLTSLEERANWMSRDLGFKGNTIMYFRTAGSLIRFSSYDYTLVSAVLLYALMGLEGLLRTVYGANQKTNFKTLLDRAVAEGLVLDAAFSNITPLPKDFLVLIGKNRSTYSEKLASLLPKLRNDCAHGDYRLSQTFLQLATHVREAVDSIWEHAISLKH